MEYKSYIKTRNTSWKILLDCKIERLPVNLNQILRTLKIRAYPYQGNEHPIYELGLKRICEQTSGLTFFRKNEPIILYDGSNSPARVRFTVAHEIGHIVLGHVQPGEFTIQNRDPHPKDSPIEQASNRFAVDLLAPACVLWGLGLHKPEDIADTCAISIASANFRAERMEILYDRSKFLSHPLERKVYQSFLPYIKEYLGRL